ncbi:cyclohexanone monooxygenase [Coniophora puteana RWD-64-598 SS2]|uniref:Cyclohexanone monooxygenase n=1 Tax=Coniophora puteana (strain RWD-64-598) TaxID=741705 RepID=A0A5M3MEP7_CONPW|nr:cyclohexanone monooxygenase [Coniophora puteana RWD-64-598 SS2]EIW77698.1 cyclohexanone monooxygenase [Coniophora puteana RWD-64-598 SS2]
MSAETYDVIIVGAGFSGMYSLFKLTKASFRCKLIEAGSDFGGTWYWNTYPGARVDTPIPGYEFSLEDLWKEWTWPEMYPNGEDLRTYFNYVDRKLGLREHCLFNSTVKSAHWDDDLHMWDVKSEGVAGVYEARSRHVIFALGTSCEPYIPNIKGLNQFSGKPMHTARWPKEGLDTQGKRVGLIGTGASGVQIVQEVGPKADKLTVFHRTPNLAVPMRQRLLQAQDQTLAKSTYLDFHQRLRETFAGYSYDRNGRKTREDTDEQREAFYEEQWSLGGFRLLVGGYTDILSSKDANDLLYQFWRRKVSERIGDEKKRAILAPEIPPHPIGAKRISLEQNYWEVMSRDNVDLVDVNEEPIVEVTKNGIRTTKRKYELDVLVLATGFDAFTGSFFRIDIRGEEGRAIQEHWKDGVQSQFGLAIDKFPNLWFMYGPHTPGAFATMPVVAEIQGDWFLNTFEYLRREEITKFVAKTAAAEAYSKHVTDLAPPLLLQADSWYVGANVPGKRRQVYHYMGGMAAYIGELEEEARQAYPSFEKSSLRTTRGV